ncbi:MAG TPA: hypothetical protein VNB94_04225, partial [Mycobacteriales bacterium]|nr:hypothetical protein [Mycobacteriales bacterium]
MSDGATTLATAIAAAVRLGSEAGLPADDVAVEAAILAAALSESARGAAVDWAAGSGRSTTDHAAFAVRGRAWRRQPSPLLSQLVERGAPGAAAYADALADVASAACSLGEPTLRAIAVATLSAAAQRRAVAASSDELADQGAGAADRLVTAYRDPRSESDSAPKSTPGSSSAPATVTGAEPALPTLEELLAELDSLIGLVGIKAE